MAPSKGTVMSIAIIIFLVAAYPVIHLLHSLFFGLLFDHHDHDATSGLAKRNLSIYQGRGLMGWLSPFNYSNADDASNYDFSVLLVSYHKTGHDLQQDLVNFINSEFPPNVGPSLTEYGNKSPLRRRRHPPKTPCARIHLTSGTISVQHAPDLFCSPEELAHILLEGGDGHTAKEDGFDRGVKIVHLVRNPYEMAVSNYHYHAQVPTPEPWVRTQNPCQTSYDEDAIPESYAEMVIPTLSKMKYGSLNVSFGGEPLFSRAEFDSITNDCLSLYQTKNNLHEASFLSHLMNYDAPEGLRLATAEMMIQGYDNGGDILRMANNIVKFKQSQMMVRNSLEYQRKKKELRVYTLSLDDFIAQPAASALKFFDFVFEEQTNVSHEQKVAVAQKYGRYYNEKIKKSKHITHGKSGDSVPLKEYLRYDPIFGPPLSKIELLVETALVDSRKQ